MKIKNESLIKKLQKIGLTDKESLVYTSLLELGSAFPSKIAEYSGLKRATTYNILTTLSIRGIINEIEKKNKLFYQIEKPEKIIRNIKDKIKINESALDYAQELVPEINNLLSLLKNQTKVTYYEGVDGLLSIYEDMINTKEPYEMLAFSKASDLIPIFPEKFLANYVQKKIEIGITTRTLVPDTEENRKYFEVYTKNNPGNLYPRMKYVAPGEFSFKGEITIYGDSKISITDFNENRLTGVVIEDPALNKMMRAIFELSWNSTLVRE